MNIFSKSPLLRSRTLVAIVAGLLWAVSFPLAANRPADGNAQIGIAGFAWLAPGLLALAGLGTRAGKSFRLGYTAGVVFHLITLSWLLRIPYRWNGLPLGPAAGWLALAGYLSLFPATWLWLTVRLAGRKVRVAGYSGSRGQWLNVTDALMSWNWAQRQAWALAGAVIWAGLEMAEGRLLGGFPFNLLGISQHQMLPLIQIASFTGVFGVSFLVAWGSLSLLCAAAAVLSRPQMRTLWMTEALVPFGCVAAVFGFGLLRLAHSPTPTRQVRIALVQPSIPQTLIWDPANNATRFQDLLRLSESALSNQTDILLWPEAAIPNLLRYDLATFVAITNLAASHHVWMIVGSDDAVPQEHAATLRDADYYNSSFLISPEGKLAGGYRKRSLVIFGEYLPLEHSLPFLKWFTPVQESFRAGVQSVAFDLPDLDLRTSVLICFEDGFPRLGRDCAALNPDFLVNITNDGWFGEGAAQWQQAASARFRTVENDLPLVRCTNNGLTCWFDACGRIRQVFTDSRGTIYGAGYLETTLELPAKGERVATFYDRHGDWFGWGCAGFVVLVGLPISVRKEPEKSVLH